MIMVVWVIDAEVWVTVIIQFVVVVVLEIQDMVVEVTGMVVVIYYVMQDLDFLVFIEKRKRLVLWEFRILI